MYAIGRFHGGNRGSNPLGDANKNNAVRRFGWAHGGLGHLPRIEFMNARG